jgi:hypothetical protein
MSLARNDKRGAVQFSFDLTVDLDKTFSGHATDYLQSFRYNCSSVP